MIQAMPYKLRGNSVVRADTGAVVKTHPTRERALKHLRALKANVEESDAGALDALLEGAFDDAKHPRGPLGRWIATFSHSVHGTMTSPIEAHSSSEALSKAQALARQSSGGRVHMTVQGVAPDVSHPRRATLGAAEGRSAAATRAEILRKSSGAQRELEQHQAIARGAHSAAQDRHGGFKVGDTVSYRTPSIVNGRVEGHSPPQSGEVAGLQRNGYLRLRHPIHGTTVDVHHTNATKARPLSIDHAKVRGYLENLPQGRYFHVSGLGNGGALARKTAAGFEVYRALQAKPEKVHKTPSAAAAHMMRIRNEGVKRARESSPVGVLGALLEGR